VALAPETVAGYDAVLIATDHDAVDYGSVLKNSTLVVDTRNACARHGLVSEKIVKA
jgi:UDP-N-acetyl-D-glucosamine dehydrogenase